MSIIVPKGPSFEEVGQGRRRKRSGSLGETLKADKGPCLLHFMGEANNAATSHLISVHFSVTDSGCFETLEEKE